MTDQACNDKHPVESGLHLRLPSEQDILVTIAESVQSLADAQSWPDSIRFHVDLVLEELVQNIVSYGYPDGRAGQVEVSIIRNDDELLISIQDDADAFDPFSLAIPDTESSIEERSIGGLGVHFARTLMDTYRYSRVEGLNRVELTKFISQTET